MSRRNHLRLVLAERPAERYFVTYHKGSGEWAPFACVPDELEAIALANGAGVPLETTVVAASALSRSKLEQYDRQLAERRRRALE